MKKSLLTTLAAALAFQVHAQTYTPVTLTGFTADVIANGSGSAANSTSVDVDGVGYNFVAQNYVGPASQTPTAYLPNNGTINSAATSGLTYQLASYTGNNSLRITGTGNGTLTFATPASADQIYLLTTSVYTSTFNVTVNFTDGTNQLFTGQTVDRWMVGTGIVAVQNVGRVLRATNVLENPANAPRIYQLILTPSAANTSKLIQNITFTKTSTGANEILHIMGISIRNSAPTLASDAGIIAISAPNSGCALSGAETITVSVKNFGSTALSNIPVSYKINATGTPVTGVVPGPVPANTSVSYSFATKANLSAIGAYAIEARTNLSGDLLATNDAFTKTVILSAAPAAPTITAGSTATFCTGGSVVLTAASTTTGATFQWFNNGTDIAGATSATYTATTAGSYTVKAALNGCESAASAATVVTVNTKPAAPGIGVSGTTNFCAGGSVTLTALVGVTGGTYSWFLNGSLIPNNTASTFAATASGNYSVAVSLNGCTSPTSSATTVTVKPAPATPTITRAGMVLTSSSLTGNQWYKNGTILTGQTARTYTATSNGAYTVIASANGCSSAASAAVNITNTGINEEGSNLAVAVYPNPSTGVFNISLAKGEEFELTVTDLSGKVIKKQNTSEGATQLNLEGAAKGIYLLQVSGEKGSAVRKLIVE